MEPKILMNKVYHCDNINAIEGMQDDYIKRKCPICETIYLADPKRLKHRRQTTCSRKCSYVFRNNKKRKQVDLICPICKRRFMLSLNRIKKTKYNYNFCSKKCMYLGKSKGLIQRIVNKPYKCKRKTKRPCLICGKWYIYQSKNQKYCSRKCFEKAHSVYMSSENAPSYIDGRSHNKKCWRGNGWDKLRINVYKRDNYTCQRCGVKCISKNASNSNNSKKIIQCHHIEKYHKTKNNNMSNLVTLCLVCHVKRDNENK